MAGLDSLLTLLSFGAPGQAPPPGEIPVREFRLAPGDRGARQMVRHMSSAALAALRQPLTIQAAAQIVPPDVPTADQALYLREWLAAHWFFHKDPAGLELLRTPDFLLQEIQAAGVGRGDCDDAATLAAALGMAAGLEARFVLVAFGDTLPFSHVFCELLTGCQGWAELDITRPDQVPEGTTMARAEFHEVRP